MVIDLFAVLLTLSRTQNVLGEKGRRIRELTAVVQKRFGFPEGSVEVNDLGWTGIVLYILLYIWLMFLVSFPSLQLYAEKVATRGLCAIAQAESLRYKLLGGLAVRR